MHCSICKKSMQPDWCYCPNCGSKESIPDTTQRLPGSIFSANCLFISGVRNQVLHVVVRSALAGAPWRQIYADQMKVNNITEEMIEEELERRKNCGPSPGSYSPPEPAQPPGDTDTNAERTLHSARLNNIAYILEDFVKAPPSILAQKQESMKNLANALRLVRLVIYAIAKMEESRDGNA